MHKKSIKLFWSRGYGKHSSHRRNFGDWMSPLICESISGRNVEFARPDKCDLFAIGSILNRSAKTHKFHKLGLSRSIDIWGSGSLKETDKFTQKHRYHCVRGQFTHERILHSPEDLAYGDPGLLCEELLPRRSQRKKHSLGIVPHEDEKNHSLVKSLSDNVSNAAIIDVHSPVIDVLTQIDQCEMVISSSLHGLIVADALGVPNGWIILSNQLTGGSYKFKDYYSCFNITNPVPIQLTHTSNIKTISDSLIDYKRQNMGTIKEKLRASFPY